MSKILELYILDVSGYHEFSDLQFGFVAGRGTNMASSLANDVISYCTKRGSPVYTCSLDAEGAFDAVPHAVLFRKAMDVIPDHCWLLMVNWYRSITVQIKWGSELSGIIKVTKGTRQGGLSSPFLFNLMYQDMINELSDCVGGININNRSYNVFCYADDIMLASLTVTGLQKMINLADRYITQCGLRFNPSKTDCVMFGQCSLEPRPEWRLNGVKLTESESVNYLGVTLSHSKPNKHVENRISACRRAFYALQGAGFSNAMTDVDTLSYVWKAAIRPVMTYGLNSVHINKGSLESMEKLQSRLLETGIGLHKFCRSSPILKALYVNKIETTIEIGCLDLTRAIFSNNSRARCFYTYLLNMHVCGKLNGHNDLISRTKMVCRKNNVNLLKYIFDEMYNRSIRKEMKRNYREEDGLADSVRQLLLSRDPYDKCVLNMLLVPF